MGARDERRGCSVKSRGIAWLAFVLPLLAAASAVSRAGDIQLPSGLAYVWWDFELPEFDDFQIDLTLHNDVETKPGLYLQVYQGHIGDVGFYLGLQTDVFRPNAGGQGKGLIFSRWKTRDVADARATADGWIESSGHEGDFVGIRRRYSWGQGRYRLRLTALDEEPGGVWYGFFILDYSTNREDYCGALRFPKQSRIKNGGGTWLEVYSGAKSSDDIPNWHVSVEECFANQRRVKARMATSDYSAKVEAADVHFDPQDGTTHFRVGKGVKRIHSKTRHAFSDRKPDQAGDPKSARKPLASGDHLRTLQIGSTNRSYLVHVPAGLAVDRPAPVVLALHGAAMNGPMMSLLSGLNRKADEAGFVVVYPSGTGRAGFLTWNSGGFAGASTESSPDDVQFIARVLDEIASLVNVDDKRVYACGMSNGAMMCYRLAAELSDRIAAIAPVAGTLAVENPHPHRPVPVLHFHGTRDRLVPIEGPNGKLSSLITFQSVADSIQTWVTLNGCRDVPEIEVLSHDDDELKVTRTTYSGGREGSEVVLIVVEGGGHTWPGRPTPARFLGKTARNVSADDLIWDFFQKHPMP